jgi:hypothetical protein
MSIYKPIDVELVPFFDRDLAEYNKKSYGIWDGTYYDFPYNSGYKDWTSEDEDDYREEIKTIWLFEACTINHRFMRNFNELKKKFPEYVKQTGHGDYYINAKEIEYAQGWFFTKKFFNNKTIVYYASSKDHMIKLLDQFIDKKYNLKKNHRRVYDISDIYNRFIDSFEDGMIFELGW